MDKNLKHHGLIQAFSRTNRVLNATKPYGNILDFRQQQEAVDAAIALFSGEAAGEKAREIWLVDKAPVVIQKLDVAVQKLDAFMKSQGLDCAPEAVPNLKGDAARAVFIEHFKEVQRLKTQLDQYTDLTPENAAAIEQVLPQENLLGFRGAYLETAQRLKAQQGKGADRPSRGGGPARFRVRPLCLRSDRLRLHHGPHRPLLPADAGQAEDEPRAAHRPHPVRRQVHGRARGHRRLYRHTEGGRGLKRKGHPRRLQPASRRKRTRRNWPPSPASTGWPPQLCKTFVDGILQRMIFDGEQLTDLMEPLGLSWKARRVKELDLMADLLPLLTKRAGGRDISGLSAYEQ